MKTLRTLLILLLGAASAFAQVDPNNLFVHGYVTDPSGNAQAGIIICIDGVSDPNFPLDSLCATTNANGYYYLEIPNGSTTGPNLTFSVSMDDPCPNGPSWQTVNVQNGQGTVDIVDLDWETCQVPNGPCSASITSYNDSINGTWTFEANATGTAPFTYDWWVDGTTYTTQTVSHMFNGGTVGVYVTITDANGCQATDGDTLFLNGNPNNCAAAIQMSINPNGVVQLAATGTGIAPFTYQWNTGETTALISNIDPDSTYCVTVADASGCIATECYVGGGNPGNCSVTITTSLDSTLNGAFYTLTASAGFSSYVWSNNVTGQSITVQGTSPNAEVYCVTATDANGCTATACDTLLPLNQSGCQAFFAWAPDSMLGSPLPAVWFTDLSQGGAMYFWDFGDNTFSTDQNPLHTYAGTGVYQVCLTIVSADSSCFDTYCETVFVGNNSGNCDASFSNSGPTPIGYSFSANVQDPNLNYQWFIDNQYVGNGYDAYSPGFSNGVHTICLTVIDSLNNCMDTQCQTITVGGNNCYGYISGAVFAGSNNQPLDEGMVYLILHDAINNTLTAIDSMPIDSGNWFFFGPLACGDYLIKAAATAGSQYYSNYIPTYYGNSPFWGFAQTVTLGQVNAQVTADVTLIASNNPGGPGFIGGDVSQGANKTDPGDPLSGMQVMLFNLNGDAIGCTYTDVNGQFGFSDLAYGTYQVYVEVLGVQTIPAVVTIGPDQPSVDNVHIQVSESLISTGIEEVDFDGAISEVYPNPVVNDAFIRIDLENEVMVDISIVDLAGRTISRQTVSVAGGENTVSIGAGLLKDGYYFLNIQDVDGTFSVTRRFMRVD